MCCVLCVLCMGHITEERQRERVREREREKKERKREKKERKRERERVTAVVFALRDPGAKKEIPIGM